MEPILRLKAIKSAWEAPTGWGTVEIRDNGAEGDDCIVGLYAYKLLRDMGEPLDDVPLTWQQNIALDDQKPFVEAKNVGDDIQVLSVESPSEHAAKDSRNQVSARLLDVESRLGILALKSGMIEEVDL